jgi:hypothetical protein
MSHRELVHWYRFEALHEPLPDRLADIHGAVLCALVVNLVRAADDQPINPRDFFVIREPEPPPPDDGLTEAERQRRAWRGDS